MRCSAGPLATLPDGLAVAIDDGLAVVVRDGDVVRAFRNRCLHQASPLEGGWVRDGVLSCPLHFWRYDLDGTCRNGHGRLESYPVTIVGDDVVVELPDSPPPTSLREQLIARARTYDRDRVWHERNDDA